MELILIDTHAHLDMGAFSKDRNEVIARASDSGITTTLVPGIDLTSSQNAVKLARGSPRILAAAGFHPHEAGRVEREDIAKLAQLIAGSAVVAIGEIGLDLYRNYAPLNKQLQVLRWQLELADNLDLPVIIHCRQAEKEMMPLLQDWASSCRRSKGKPRGVIHCFNGDGEALQKYLDMDFLISVGAYIGYPSSMHARDVIRKIPENRLLVETDSPFLPPQIHRGKRNEPAYLVYTVRLLASIRGVTIEAIAAATTQNARNLFSISDVSKYNI